MKITRTSAPNSVKASQSAKHTENVSASVYAECENYIRSAINSLGTVAKDDVKAREAIANLSVVLFDIK